MEPVAGIEPTTDGLQNRCSTTELNWRRRQSFYARAGRFGKFTSARRENRVRHAVDDFFVGGNNRRQHAAQLRTRRVAFAG